MQDSSTDRRLWRCPACATEYRIPAAADDPLVCPRCEPLDLPRVIPEHVGPPKASIRLREMMSRPLPQQLVAGLVVASIGFFLFSFWISGRETAGQKAVRENNRKLAEIEKRERDDAGRRSQESLKRPSQDWTPENETQIVAKPAVHQWVKVAELSGRGPKQSERFLTGGVLRVNWIASPSNRGAGGYIGASIIGEGSFNEQLAINESIEAERTDSTLVRLKPGSAYLDVNAASVGWTIVIEDQR